MANLAERVGALETRVGELEIEVRRATDLDVTATRDAHTARDAHQRNIELLNALRATQAAHSRTLAEHGHTLAEHTDRFDAIDGKLGQLTVGMHTIESLLRGMTRE